MGIRRWLEQKQIKCLDSQLIDEIQKKFPKGSFGEMHYLFPISPKRPSLIIGRYVLDRDSSYFATQASTTPLKKTFFATIELIEDLSFTDLYSLMKKMFLESIKYGVRERIYDKEILNEFKEDDNQLNFPIEGMTIQ